MPARSTTEPGGLATLVRYQPEQGGTGKLVALVIARHPDGTCDLQVFKTSGDGSYLVRGAAEGIGPGTWGPMTNR